MRTKLFGSIIFGGVLVILSAGLALSQPMMGPRGTGPGVGPGAGPGFGPGMMGRGGGRHYFADPAAYLDGLKADMRITTAQEPSWNSYAEVVKAAAVQMQGAHQTMYDAMGTANWQERRDMMNRMFEARQQAFDSVHAAAEKLLPELDATQKAQAGRNLPGLVVRGPMMGRRPI